jgi:predicted nucleic acid-binding protein
MKVLIDSSILVALIADKHPKNTACHKAFKDDERYIFYDHSALEAYRVLTYPNVERGGYNLPAMNVAHTIQDMTQNMTVIGMSSTQRFDVLAKYSERKVISARIYDAMIGYAGIIHGAQRIMTLNGKNFRSLFPELAIIEPV